MTAIRTLPLYLDPVPGEALDSWLAAIAHRSHTAWADMLTAAGLETAGTAVARGSWLLEIEGHRLEELAAAVGIDTAMIKSMTRSRYDGTALDIGRDPIRRTRRFPWGYVGRSRYCPHCLAQTGTVAAGVAARLVVRLRGAPVSTRRQLSPVWPAPARRRSLAGDVVPQPGRCGEPRSEASGRASPRCNAESPLRQQFCFPPSTPSWRPSAPSMRFSTTVSPTSASTPTNHASPGPRCPISARSPPTFWPTPPPMT